MKNKLNIILTENQYNVLFENMDDIFNIYAKIGNNERLSPTETYMLKAFQRFQSKGGKMDDFEYDPDGFDDYDEREGMRFEYNLKGRPFTFEFSEEMEKDGEIEYYGEVTFMGDEFLGVIATDKRGYLITYDFYSVLSDDDVRLQNILKSEDSDAEIQNFFQEEIIPNLRK